MFKIETNNQMSKVTAMQKHKQSTKDTQMSKPNVADDKDFVNIQPPKPAYFSQTPAEVRYCKHLEPHAKLLYGELTALANTYGYCWASNRYFADLYEVDIRTVKRWIESLEQNGFIALHTVHKGFVKERKIFIRKDLKEIYTKGQKCPHRRDKNVPTEGTKMSPVLRQQNNTQKQQQPAAPVVVVFSCLENIDPSVTQKEKERISSKYEEQTVKDAIAAVKAQGFQGSFIKSLNAACRDKWKPTKAEKEDTEANKKYAKEVEEAINLKPEIRKKYIINAGPKEFEIAQTQGQRHFYLDYTTPGFREKLETAFRERKIH